MSDSSYGRQQGGFGDSNWRIQHEQLNQSYVPQGFGSVANAPPGHHGQPAPGPNQQQTKLTHDDMMMLKECNRESFYQRCVPFMIATNTLAFIYLRKVAPGSTQAKKAWCHLGATCFGWFTGKLSYRSKCTDKIIMSNLDTPLARKMRQSRGMVIEYSENYVPPNDDTSYLDLPVHDNYQDNNLYNNQDRGSITDSSFYGDDSSASSASSFLDPSPKEPIVTYDSLREANRRSYQQEPIRRQF